MENSEPPTPNEQLQIKMEEVYKNEVRKMLEKKEGEKSKNKVWLFLNTSFGLWFLSTCVVGMITFFYSQHQENERNKLEQIKATEHSEIEKRQNAIEHARRNASLVTVLLPYLASQDEKQWQMAIQVTKYLQFNGELPGELESALIGIVESGRISRDSVSPKNKVSAAAAVLDIQKTVNTDSANFSNLPPRVYIQISGENQRPIAKLLQAKLRAENFIAPGVENISTKAIIPESTEVRYYRVEEKKEAEKIIAILNSLNLGLQIKNSPQKISATGQGTRPRHYEIWFSK